MPNDVLQALDASSSVKDLLRYFQKDEKLLTKYKAGVEYVDQNGEQRGALPKERRNLRGRINEVLRLVDAGEVDPESLYVAEMRLLNAMEPRLFRAVELTGELIPEAIKHPIDGELVKTVCQRDVKDVMGPLASWTFYWDRHDEGVFIGNRGSGKGIHVDQVLWSNVGKNWRGYKLVAAWPKGAVSNSICKNFDDQLFSPPLSEAKVQALRQAAKIVLLRPGDVYFFSGGTAHTALCVSEGMGLSSYESIVTLHPLHSGLCMQTCDRSSPCWLEGAMPRDEFEDILEEAVEQLEAAAKQVLEASPGVDPDSKASPFDPPLWSELRLQLRSDKAAMRLLQEHFAATVAQCLCRSPFVRENASATLKRALRYLTNGRGLMQSMQSPRSPSREPSSSRAPPDRAAVLARRRSRPVVKPPPVKEIPIEACQWQYMDTKGNLQGPFSSQQMALWNQHNMLPKTLRLRRTIDTAFSTVDEYFPAPSTAFKSQPVVPSANAGKASYETPKPAEKRPNVAPPKVSADAALANLGPLASLFANATAAAHASAQQAMTQAVKKGEKGEKGKGKGSDGDHPKQGRGKAKEKAEAQNNGWSWSAEHGWTNDKSWWEWSSWNGWETENWENGKHSEWKSESPPGKEKGEKGVTAVQAAFGSLNWGPPFKDVDLFPEDPLRRVLDEGIVWEDRWISPLAVRFSQGKIHPFFHERGPISEVMSQMKLKTEDGKRIKRIDPPFPPIRLLHLKEQGVLVTLDNRRLYALQRFALQEWPTPCLVRALCVDELTPTRCGQSPRVG
eukprot:s321_g5.t1